MGFKQTGRIALSVIAIAGGLAAGIYYVATGDPTPIKVDPRIYDDYAGYYISPSGYPVTIQRKADRLMSTAPEHMPRELFPETETQFFIKGSPGRWIFHRDDKG